MIQEIDLMSIGQHLVGQEIQIRGVIIFKNDNSFIIQEYDSTERSKLETLSCVLDDDFQMDNLKIGLFVKSRGLLNNDEKGHYFLETTEVQLLTKDEVAVQFSKPVESFFSYENLKKFMTNSSGELIQILQEKANHNGINLVRKASSKQTCVKLLCQYHGKYQKNPNLNTNCQFFINISAIKGENNELRWHVTKVNDKHNHLLDRMQLIHKKLSQDKKDFIITLANTGVELHKIESLVLSKYKIFLSKEQIRSICRDDKNFHQKEKIAETEELEQYMKLIDGCSFIYPSDTNKVPREGIATFTKYEIDVLTKYGDFVSIDPTFSSMSSNWIIIPITTVGEERELCSGGLIFASKTKAEIFRWILDLLLNVLPTKNLIKTLISDEDHGL